MKTSSGVKCALFRSFSTELQIHSAKTIRTVCLSEGEKRGEAKEEEEKEENELTYVQKSCIAARYT